MRNEKAPAEGGSFAERADRLVSVNYSNHGTLLECRYRPERNSRQKGEADDCRLDVFLQRLRDRGQRVESHPEIRG